MLKKNFFAEALGLRKCHEALVESELKRYPVDKGKDHCAGMNNVYRFEIPVAHSLLDNSPDSLAGPLIRGLVDRCQCRVMQRLAP